MQWGSLGGLRRLPYVVSATKAGWRKTPDLSPGPFVTQSGPACMREQTPKSTRGTGSALVGTIGALVTVTLGS